MPRPATKDALLEASNAELQLLFAEIDSIPENLQNTEFPFEGGDRNIKDVVCHLHEWHKLMLGWYEVGMRGEKPDIPAPGYTWKTTPALNEALRAKHADTALLQALDALRASHDEVRSLIAAHTDEELFTKQRYPWTGTTSLGAYLVSSTSSHYDWARKKVRKLKKHLAL
ncbi:MAG: ClbS/DfsB family four-helix bundle protein [Coriobacteriia bacterium]